MKTLFIYFGIIFLFTRCSSGPAKRSVSSGINESDSESSQLRRIAIAPPQGTYELLSDKLGTHLEEILQQKYPDHLILPFKETYPWFDSFSYDYSKTIWEPYRPKLYQELQSHYLLETQVQKEGEKIHIKSQLIETRTRLTTDSFSQTLDYSKHEELQDGAVPRTFSYLLNIVPNTFFIDFTGSDLSFQANPALSQPQSNLSFNALSLLTSFALRKSRNPKLNGFGPFFRIIPDANSYFDRFSFNNSPQLKNQEFTWISVSAGVGVEIGLDTPWGYLYYQGVPSVAQNWISSSKHSVSKTSLEMNWELGYQFFITERMTIRIFNRFITGPSSTWETLLSQASGESFQLNKTSLGILGLALGYYFPEGRTRIKEYFFSSPR